MPRDKHRQASGKGLGGGSSKKAPPKTTTTGDQTKGKAARAKSPPKKRYPDTIRSPRSRTEKFVIGASKAVNKLGHVGSALAGAAGVGLAGNLAGNLRSAASREATQKAAQNYQRTLKKK